jgi:O-antigen/teichoic acid export membrane protein
MKKLIKQLAGESIVYGLSGIINKFISVFLVPLYTRILLPSDYGVLNLVNTTFYFVAIFVVFALDNSAARWFYDSDNTEERKKPIATWFWVQLIISVFICLLFIGLSTPLSKLILGKNLPLLLIIPSVTIVSSVLPTIVWNWLRLRRKVWLTVTLSTSSAILTIGLNVLFTIVLKQGIKGILLATLISNSIYSVAASLLMWRWLSPKFFSVEVLKGMLRFALPLLPTALAFWILNSSASFFIKYYHSNEEVGLFSIASSIASSVAMLVGAFQMAWGPFAFSIMNKPEAKSVYSAVLTLYSIVALTAALAVALFAKEILFLLTTPKYYPAYLVSGILAFNATIYGYAYIGGIGSSVVKKTSPIAFAIMIGSIVCIVLYFILIPIIGKEGAALSTLTGYLIIPIYVFYRSQQLWHIPYKFMPTVILLCSAFALFIVNNSLPEYSISYSIVSKLILLLIFLSVCAIVVYYNYKTGIDSYLQKKYFKLP